MNTQREITLRWMPQNTFDEKLTIRQQAITRANVDPDMLLYGINRPQWVNWGTFWYVVQKNQSNLLYIYLNLHDMMISLKLYDELNHVNDIFLGTDQATSHYLNQWLLVYW